MPYDNNQSLETVVRCLGVEGSSELFRYALPRLSQRKKELQKHLSKKDWQAASQSACRAIGSVRLYGSAKLEILLDEIILLGPDEVDFVSLRKEVSVEFDHSIRAIRRWLKIHTKS